MSARKTYRTDRGGISRASIERPLFFIQGIASRRLALRLAPFEWLTGFIRSVAGDSRLACRPIIAPPRYGEMLSATPGLRPPPGLGKGIITVISDDDEHLKDFEEYMP
jgi:hypothetical protein